MKNNLLKRIVSFLLAFVMCIPAITGLGITASAAGIKGKSYMVSFPRENDAKVDYSGSWGHKAHELMNGWSLHKSKYTTFFTMNDYGGKICYCIEPGTPAANGNEFTQKDESFWDNYPDKYNKTIDADTIKLMIGRILQYGFTGNVELTWVSQDPNGANKIAQAAATQVLIWETIVGERDANFNHVDPGSKSPVLNMFENNHPLRSLILSYYNDIATKVQNHSKLPSFFERSIGKSKTVELEWNGTQYIAELSDSNGVLGDYNFSSDNSDLKFSVSGNKLTITSKSAPNDTVSITASRKNSQRKGLVVWNDGKYAPGDGQQDLVSYTQSVNDPVKGYLKVKVSYGSAKIVKVSEDGKVDGITFRIQGNGIDKTVKTANGGVIQVDNLKPGIYTVTETEYDKYIPQEVRRVTVVSGQVSTVNFSNKLRRGDLTVKKTAEDGLTEGMKFRLYGTSLSGIEVNEYAVTDKNGVAKFKDVLIGTGYTLEEVDTSTRYVVPDKQTAAVEWNKVTNKSFDNVLKKFNVTVTKSDSEKGLPQGNASLAGAKYGIYKGNQLIDTYTTDAKGQFTTKYYICGDDWSLKEISPSEGYLLNTESQHIGAEAKLYTVKYNLAKPLDSLEDVIKGKIAVIKHCDDGTTKIETPEKGAEFEVYLKAAGSYENADETERDILVCDENGFAETKDLPYGEYTVNQTKGWEGKELLAPFNVFVKENGETYRFLINNATFEALIEIVKKDAETGKIIPASGIGFKVRNTDTGEYIVQHINYPTPVDIDTYYTDVTGKLMMPEKLPYGNYEIIEQCTAYGYVLDSAPIAFKVDGSKTVVTVEKHNMPQKGIVNISKSGEVFFSAVESNGVYGFVFADKGLAGAVYEITAAEDIITPDGTLRYAKGTVVDTVTTDENGNAASKLLYLGKYTVRETTAPYGMVLNDEAKSVELTYAGETVKLTETSAEFYNERQKAEVSLSKILGKDETFGIGNNGEILSVQFGLYTAEDLTAADGSVIPTDGLLEIANCNENGSITFKTDIPVGAKLYVKEIAADSHYILSDKKHPVTFDYAGQNTAFVEIKANGGEAIKNDILYGSVKGLKIDRETEVVIAGAKFGLFRSGETEFTAENAILTTESGEDGVFTFENIPYGDWLIKELQPADGYLANEEIYPVSITENEQTVEITVINDHIPEVKTTAAVDGDKEVCATEVFTMTDAVSYSYLIPGKEYVLKGTLMDKNTGKAFTENGEAVTAETVFTPETPNGTVTVSFTFDSRLIKENTSLVVFETLYKDGKELAVHADIEDEDQTVKVTVPEIGTKATVNGEKSAVANGDITIEDTVSYKNLTVGKEYTVKGILMDKATGKPFLVNGKEVTSEVTFTAEKKGGEITVRFTFDGSKVTKQTDIVVFETLYRDGVEITTHADIEDGGQTVTLTPPAPLIPQTGDNSNLGFWIGLGAVALGGIIAVVIIRVKSRKDKDDV